MLIRANERVYRECILLVFNSFHMRMCVRACVCTRARSLLLFCIIFRPVISALVSTNRLIKLITDWTNRRKMMEWIEHKLSNGWKAIDWINTYEQRRTSWVQTYRRARTHPPTHACISERSSKKKAKSLFTDSYQFIANETVYTLWLCVVLCCTYNTVSLSSIQPSVIVHVYCICISLHTIYIYLQYINCMRPLP